MINKKLNCWEYGGRGEELKVPYYASAVAVRDGNVPHVKATCLTSRQHALNNSHLPLFPTYIKGINNIKINVLSKKAELQNSTKPLNTILRMDKDGKIKYNYLKLIAVYKVLVVYWI